MIDASALREARTKHMTVADLDGARRACLVTCVTGVLQVCYSCTAHMVMGELDLQERPKQKRGGSITRGGKPQAKGVSLSV
jgi:ABC-type uncharacterized transport system YnjBCD ATPase subunit